MEPAAMLDLPLHEKPYNDTGSQNQCNKYDAGFVNTGPDNKDRTWTIGGKRFDKQMPVSARAG